jgi:translation elongation factor EF-1alpha
MGREDEIRLIAYRIWEEEGCQDGHDCEHWFKAEALWEERQKVRGELVGNVGEFFARPVVAGIKLTGSVKIGDRLRIKGHTTDIEFNLDSMQIDRKAIKEGKPGDNIGVKVPERVRVGDSVYKVSE